jgi:dCTP diphosphatase
MAGTEEGYMQHRQSFEALRAEIREFAQAREWEQFHTPKNLSMALIVEAAELVEPFQWLTPEQSRTLDAETQRAVAEEIGDVLIYLTRLADVLGIDPLQAAFDKIAVNARKYPVEKARGHNRKYDKLD